MTTTENVHSHHSAIDAHVGTPNAAAWNAGRRRRWLIPALAIGGAIAAVLVISGLVSPAVLIYGGLLAGCGLMHLFGHGGHGSHGGGTPPAAR